MQSEQPFIMPVGLGSWPFRYGSATRPIRGPIKAKPWGGSPPTPPPAQQMGRFDHITVGRQGHDNVRHATPGWPETQENPGL